MLVDCSRLCGAVAWEDHICYDSFVNGYLFEMQIAYIPHIRFFFCYLFFLFYCV